jgi:DNA-binding transcriptional ArsR family regulator
LITIDVCAYVSSRTEVLSGYVPPVTDSRVVVVGRALAEPARATMLARLMSGTAHTATELARAALVAASTASEHLRILADAGLVTIEASGRHRYYRLASPELAAWLEAIDELDLPHEIRRPSVVIQRPESHLAFARSCYDHVAGRGGVQLWESLERDGIVETTTTGAAVTPAGRGA